MAMAMDRTSSPAGLRSGCVVSPMSEAYVRQSVTDMLLRAAAASVLVQSYSRL